MDTLARAAQMTPAEVAKLIAKHERATQEIAKKDQALAKKDQAWTNEVKRLSHRVKWLEKQLFGVRSERRALEVCEPADQLALELEMLKVETKPPGRKVTVKQHEKQLRDRPTQVEDAATGGLRFDERTTVVEVIAEDPAIAGVAESDLVVLGEERHHTIIQLPPYAVVATICRTTKNKLTGKISCPKVPEKVFDRCCADVSFLASLVVDKYRDHLPGYRQHQRLEACGIELGRKNLTLYTHRVAELLEPIWQEQLTSIFKSEVLSADETPTPAGRQNGKIKKGFYWAFHGDQNELAFIFSPSRSHQVAKNLLQDFKGTLLSDGYQAYEEFSKASGVLWANCWAHVRRKFIESEAEEPTMVGKLIKLFQSLYEIEARGRGKPKLLRDLRKTESRPIVDELFRLIDKEYQETSARPSSAYLEALVYARNREGPLRVFLENPDLPIDNNHTERSIRPTAVGRKNWMFHFTEDGARKGAILYSLIWTCRLQGIDPVTYLIDVLQRVSTHPASDTDLLTPRLWKENFAANPMRSIVSRLTLAPR